MIDPQAVKGHISNCRRGNQNIDLVMMVISLSHEIKDMGLPRIKN